MKALRELYVQMQQRTELAATSHSQQPAMAATMGQRARITIRGGKGRESLTNNKEQQ